MHDEEVVSRLTAAFRLSLLEADEDATHEFVFHVRECAADLERLVTILKDVSHYSDVDIKEALDGVLLHAAGHIVQAARLYGGFIDTFGAEASANDPPQH